MENAYKAIGKDFKDFDVNPLVITEVIHSISKLFYELSLTVNEVAGILAIMQKSLYDSQGVAAISTDLLNIAKEQEDGCKVQQ